MDNLYKLPEQRGEVVDLNRYRERRTRSWAEAPIPEHRSSLASRLASKLSPLAIMDALRPSMPIKPDLSPNQTPSVEQAVKPYIFTAHGAEPSNVIPVEFPHETE